MAVTTLAGADIATLLHPEGPRRQPLAGFDDTYVDLVDYIIRCTHRIWEQKDIGLIETHYAADCPIHTLTGTARGVEGVIAGTIKTLAGFPDRTLYGEAVIWSGDERAGYLSSHRIVSHATHLGPNEFGPPSGRRAVFTTIADCLCRENRIVEEWLVRDNAAIALQLGVAPRALARAQAEADRAGGVPQPWRTEQMAAVREGSAPPFRDAPVPPAADAEAFAAFVFEQLHALRRFGHVRTLYAPNARWFGPSARRLFGWGEIVGWLAALYATFPDGRVAIDHVAGVEEDGARLVAVRWRLAGRHDGPALYGAPTGRDTLILAVTHWRIEDERITEEHTIFDEIAVLRQLEGGL